MTPKMLKVDKNCVIPSSQVKSFEFELFREQFNITYNVVLIVKSRETRVWNSVWHVWRHLSEFFWF